MVQINYPFKFIEQLQVYNETSAYRGTLKKLAILVVQKYYASVIDVCELDSQNQEAEHAQVKLNVSNI